MREEDPPVAEKNNQQAPNDSLILLHITEYNALTTRNNNWVAIQVGIWSVIVLYLTAVSAVYPHIRQVMPSVGTYIVWGSGIVIQSALCMLYFTLQEIYRNVYYIEHDLRGQIQPIVGQHPFWAYETFLAKEKDRSPSWTDGAAAGAFFVALLLTAWIRLKYWNFKEASGLCVNLAVFLFLAWQVYKTIRVRERFQSPR